MFVANFSEQTQPETVIKFSIQNESLHLYKSPGLNLALKHSCKILPNRWELLPLNEMCTWKPTVQLISRLGLSHKLWYTCF